MLLKVMKGGGVKTFFDGVFMNKEQLEEEGIEYPIKLEYYKTSIDEKNVETKYGIEIVKTEYLDGNVKIETKEFICSRFFRYKFKIIENIGNIIV